MLHYAVLAPVLQGGSALELEYFWEATLYGAADLIYTYLNASVYDDDVTARRVFAFTNEFLADTMDGAWVCAHVRLGGLLQ